MTTQSHSLRLADELVREPFIWPGGYPRFAIQDDGGCLCHSCCHSERESIATTTGSDGWAVKALDVNWEDNELRCDHCGELIPAAYGGD